MQVLVELCDTLMDIRDSVGMLVLLRLARTPDYEATHVLMTRYIDDYIVCRHKVPIPYQNVHVCPFPSGSCSEQK